MSVTIQGTTTTAVCTHYQDCEYMDEGYGIVEGRRVRDRARSHAKRHQHIVELSAQRLSLVKP